MKLDTVIDGIWVATGQVSPGPGVKMETRTTVIRKPGGGLLVHSPIALGPWADEVDTLGEVEDLVAPNLFHHLFLSAARARWSGARAFGPTGLEQKNPAVGALEPLGPPGDWNDCFRLFEVAGMPNFREWVLLHTPSRTLIPTDLIFNEPVPLSFTSGLFFRLFGTYGKLSVSRLFLSMVKDKAAFAASLVPLVELEVDRVIMAHGKILEERAQERFREVLAPHLPGG